MNVVVSEKLSMIHAVPLINYARKQGFNALSFRSEVRSGSRAQKTPLEKYFYKHMTLISEDSCPVCRGSVFHTSDGFEVRFKAGVPEPSIESGGVFEAVLHPDGNLYADWSRLVPLSLNCDNLFTPSLPHPLNLSQCHPPAVKASGCGARTSGC